MQIQIPVTQEFLAHRLNNQKKYKQGRRTPVKFLMDLDCELPEFYLYNHIPNLKKSPTWQYDIIHPTLNRCDLKQISTNNYITIKNHLTTSFDHYVFWKWITPHNKPTELNESYTIEITKVAEKSYMKFL